jgi:hypothetical protein
MNQPPDKQDQGPRHRTGRDEILSGIIDREKLEMEIALLEIAIGIAPHGLMLSPGPQIQIPRNQNPTE